MPLLDRGNQSPQRNECRDTPHVCPYYFRVFVYHWWCHRHHRPCGVECHGMLVPSCLLMPQQGILLEDQHFEMCPWALGHSASGLGRFANPLVQSDLKVETQQATNTFIFPSSPNTLLATVHRHHFHCMLCTQFVPINTAAASPALSTLAVIARDLNLRLSASDDHFLLTNIAICALRRHHQEVEVVLWDGIIARLRLLNIQARILTMWRHTTGDAPGSRSVRSARCAAAPAYASERTQAAST